MRALGEGSHEHAHRDEGEREGLELFELLLFPLRFFKMFVLFTRDLIRDNAAPSNSISQSFWGQMHQLKNGRPIGGGLRIFHTCKGEEGIKISKVLQMFFKDGRWLGKRKLCFINCPIMLQYQSQFVYYHASKKAELCSILLYGFYFFFFFLFGDSQKRLKCNITAISAFAKINR